MTETKVVGRRRQIRRQGYVGGKGGLENDRNARTREEVVGKRTVRRQ